MMPNRELPAAGADRVSILVVLDWTMMPVVADAIDVAEQRFNPCCIGLDNDAMEDTSDDYEDEGFQSLLYWIGQ